MVKSKFGEESKSMKFEGLNKRRKNELKKDYFKYECKNLLLSYIFIIFSSSTPFFSCENNAIWVLIWFTISVFFTIHIYVNQNDYMVKKKKARKYFRRHKNQQEGTGASYFPHIGGWNFIGMQLLVALLFCVALALISFYLQSKNLESYKIEYMNRFVGIFMDTYIVTFFNIILQFIIAFIYDYAKDRVTLKNIASSLKSKDIAIYAGSIIILIIALTYYFNREFEGLFGDIGRKIMGSIYIIFMIYPLIKCLVDVNNSKKKVH